MATSGEVHSHGDHGGTPIAGWCIQQLDDRMVHNGKSLMFLDDVGVPPFQETTMWLVIAATFQ